MKLKNNFLLNYLENAPIALAIERSLECEILSKQNFIRPVLDLGCGDGTFVSVLFDEKIDVGVDPNKRELKRAAEYGMYKELVQCQGNNIPKEAGFFNTIFSNSVLEHIPEFQSVLNEVYRLLARGGKFYVTIPSDMFDRYTVLYQLLCMLRLHALAEKYRRFFNIFWKHFNYHKREDWEKIFRDLGFDVLEFNEYDSKPICLFNDFLIPFAFPAFIIKKIMNRWIMFKGLRRFYIYPFYLIVKGFIKKYKNTDRGGIIFFSLVKK